MYQGEVNVAQEELNSFLAVAKDLKTPGSTRKGPGASSSSNTEKQRAPSPKISRPPAPPERDPVPPPKRPRPAPPPQSYHQDDDDIQEVQPIVKSEPVSAPAEVVPQQQQYAVAGQQSQQQVALEDDAYADESYDYGEYGDGGYDDGSGMIDPNTGLPIQGAAGADGNKGLDELIEQCLGRNPDGLWQWLYCQFSALHKHHVKNHCEAKHVSSGGVVCLNCGATCPTRKALAMHMSRKHKHLN